MQNNQSAILIAAAFTMIGFALGRVTAPVSEPVQFHRAMTFLGEGNGSSEVDDIQVMITSLDEEGFEGDTTFAIPGGTVIMTKNGESLEVEIETNSGDVEGAQKEGVEKRTVVVVGQEN